MKDSGSPSNWSDKADYVAWLARIRPSLHRYCARLVGSVFDGEDIVQDTLIKAIAEFDKETTLDHPQAWLFRVAHNAAHDFLRRRRKEGIPASETALERLEDDSAAADTRLVVSTSMKTFLRLPAGPRAAVILKDVLGYTLEDIVLITSSTLPSVKAALHRGRGQLKILAADQSDDGRALLDSGERRLLEAYVDHFNARDFAALANMLAADVKIELVDGATLNGSVRASTYFGNYTKLPNLIATVGFADGAAAVLFVDDNAEGMIVNVALIGWINGQIARVRDYRHVPYILGGANLVVDRTPDH